MRTARAIVSYRFYGLSAQSASLELQLSPAVYRDELATYKTVVHSLAGAADMSIERYCSHLSEAHTFLARQTRAPPRNSMGSLWRGWF